ncbi:MAG: hypothetical protein AMXMBFR64_60810 [Myxococcales bacterium]
MPAVDLSVSLTVAVEELEELTPGVSALRGAVSLSDLPDVGPFDVEVECDGMDGPVLERGTYLRKPRADVAYTAPRTPKPKPAPKRVVDEAQEALPGVETPPPQEEAPLPVEDATEPVGRHDCTLSGKIAIHTDENFPYFALHDAVGATVAVTFMEHAAMRAEVEELLVETPVQTFIDCRGEQLVIEDRRREFIGAVVAKRQAGEEVAAAFWRVSTDFATRYAPKPMEVAPYPHEEEAPDHPNEWELLPGAWFNRADVMLTASGIYEASLAPESKAALPAKQVVIRTTKALSGKKGNVPVHPAFMAMVEAMIAEWDQITKDALDASDSGHETEEGAQVLA